MVRQHGLTWKAKIATGLKMPRIPPVRRVIAVGMRVLLLITWIMSRTRAPPRIHCFTSRMCLSCTCPMRSFRWTAAGTRVFWHRALVHRSLTASRRLFRITSISHRTTMQALRQLSMASAASRLIRIFVTWVTPARVQCLPIRVRMLSTTCRMTG